MSDCNSVDASLPIRQGDIFKHVDEKNVHFLLVMSADCDIAQRKVGPAGLACVSVVPLSEYLLSDVAASQCERKLERRISELATWVDKQRRTRDESCVKISSERLAEWLSEKPSDEIANALEIADSRARQFLIREAAAIVGAKDALGTGSKYSAVDALIRLQSQPMERRDQIKAVAASIDPKSLPIDAFFVSVIPGEEGLGYIAKLRAISFLTLDRVFTSLSAAKEHERAYVRVGRLEPTFRHGAAQQFGMLFARIGFPRSYEGDREASFGMLAESIFDELEGEHD